MVHHATIAVSKPRILEGNKGRYKYTTAIVIPEVNDSTVPEAAVNKLFPNSLEDNKRKQGNEVDAVILCLAEGE